MMNRKLLLLVMGGLALLVLACQSQAPTSEGSGGALPVVTVYKSPTCGCCTKWADHLKANGFQVKARNLADAKLMALKAQQGVPSSLQACHTALVEGYVIEGHVPAREVQRLLEERPNVRGLAVPGMPLGSPGMEAPQSQPYTVYAFDGDGQVQVFAQYP